MTTLVEMTSQQTETILSSWGTISRCVRRCYRLIRRGLIHSYILFEISKGTSTQEIAEAMGMSTGTIANYLTQFYKIYKIEGYNKRIQLMRLLTKEMKNDQ